MLKTESGVVVSPTDLVGFLACEHRLRLEWIAVRDGIRPPFDGDPVLDLVNRKGREHEARHLQSLRAQGLSIVDLSNRANKTAGESAATEQETVRALREGADVVYQGVFFDGLWRGRPDFLIKVAGESSLGGWSYEVADTKLAREVKAGAIVQLVLYSLRLSELQGVAPLEMRVITGDSGSRRFRLADYAAYVRVVRDRLVASLADGDPLASSYPHPVKHCRVCNWAAACIERRRLDDHTSLVAGMTRAVTRKLVEQGIPTTAALGQIAGDTLVKDLAKATLLRLREQAALQLEQRKDGIVRYRLIGETLQPPIKAPAPRKKDPEPTEPTLLGLTSLPLPTGEDLFFDIEADPWAGDGAGRGDGLEYLFGILSVKTGTPCYEPLWAHSPAEEKWMLEAFIDRCQAARAANPGFHVYHYGAYEVAALKRLVNRYGTRDLVLDSLLRADVFVDLYSVVRQGLRISQDSYSLKKIEALYMPRREGPITRGGFSVLEYERWLDDRDQKHLDDLAAYNRDDCLSTWRLRDWLEDRRLEGEALLGVPIPRPPFKSGEPKPEVAEEIAATQRRIDRLREGVSVVAEERDPESDARWRLSLLLDFHRREARPLWWRHFELRGKSPAELVSEADAIGELAFEGIVGSVKQSTIYRYRFDPEQPQKFNEGESVVDPVTGGNAGTIVAIDAAAGIVDLKRADSGTPHPHALVPSGPLGSRALSEALGRLADDVIARGVVVESGPFRAARDLLLRRPPRVEGHDEGAPIRRDGETTVGAASRAITGLRDSCLAIQGPPGTGKTWTAAQVILKLHAEGKRIGLTGPSHKVIGNLIEAVIKEANRTGVSLKVAQKADEGEEFVDARVERVKDNAALAKAAASDTHIAAGTAWAYASKEMGGQLDVLFIDEAGQFSLANACAASSAARSLVLIGDPNQLPQVTKGTHPESAGLSALEHALNGAHTLGLERGLFLDQTHRLHPDLCALVSDVFYEGKLASHPKTQGVRIGGAGFLGGTGLRLRPVAHFNCSSRSREEVAIVVDLVCDLLGRTWVDREGATRSLTAKDILVVAPFNAQVAAIREGVRVALGTEARVGTVDKFQGQEGAVVLYSMTCSSAEDAPRDMEFLYSPNRLNVSISRAQALAVLIYSPDLLRVNCQTPEQIKLANALCRIVESVDARFVGSSTFLRR
jgi:predicted RecB family nuclease